MHPFVPAVQQEVVLWPSETSLNQLAIEHLIGCQQKVNMSIDKLKD